MSTALITLIHTKWEEANREKDLINDPLAETPKVTEARHYEQLLTDRMEGTIEDFQNGLISASEFVGRINVLAAIPVGEGE